MVVKGLTLTNHLLVLRVLTALLVVVDCVGDSGPDGSESQRTEDEERSMTTALIGLTLVIATRVHPAQNLGDHPSCVGIQCRQVEGAGSNTVHWGAASAWGFCRGTNS
jgi:hypothetical protein